MSDQKEQFKEQKAQTQAQAQQASANEAAAMQMLMGGAQTQNPLAMLPPNADPQLIQAMIGAQMASSGLSQLAVGALLLYLVFKAAPLNADTQGRK